MAQSTVEESSKLRTSPIIKVVISSAFGCTISSSAHWSSCTLKKDELIVPPNDAIPTGF